MPQGSLCSRRSSNDNEGSLTESMRILLNGDSRDVDSGISVGTLLDELGLDARVVAVEVNRSVVKRDRYAATVIPEDAEVEIVAFVGGGSGRRVR